MFKDPFSADITQNGSQFTFFLTAPLQAFCQMTGFALSDSDIVSLFQFFFNGTFSLCQLVLFSSVPIFLLCRKL